MANGPTLPGPEQSRRRLISFAPLVAKKIRTSIDPGLGLDLECEHRNQNDGIASVIENLVDIVCAIDGWRDKTCRLRKCPFCRNYSRFLGLDTRVDGLP